mgnify:FL=1
MEKDRPLSVLLTSHVKIFLAGCCPQPKQCMNAVPHQYGRFLDANSCYGRYNGFGTADLISYPGIRRSDCLCFTLSRGMLLGLNPNMASQLHNGFVSCGLSAGFSRPSYLYPYHFLIYIDQYYFCGVSVNKQRRSLTLLCSYK